MAKSNLPDPVKSILVFRLGGLGDYVLTLPFFKALKKRFPGAKVSAVVGAAGEDILRNQGCIDEFVFSTVMARPASKIFEPFAIFGEVLRLKKSLTPPYDLYIDLTSKYSAMGGLKPFLVKNIARPNRSVGLDYCCRGSFLDERVKEERTNGEHVLLRYGRVMQTLGGDSNLGLPEIQIPEPFKIQAAKFYQSTPNHYLRLGFHPGANRFDFEARAWSKDRFADLIQKIHKLGNAQIFISASESEGWLVEAIQKKVPAKISRIPAGKNVLELCAYLRELDGFISNDTGPMHVAACLGVPTVGIFGKSDYASYGTYPPAVPLAPVLLPPEAIFQAFEKNDPRGLKKISVEQVYQIFLKSLNVMSARKNLRL